MDHSQRRRCEDRSGDQRGREREKNLQAFEKEEGAASQRKQVASRNWKRKGGDSPPELPE